jgi:hypothetical protein
LEISVSVCFAGDLDFGVGHGHSDGRPSDFWVAGDVGVAAFVVRQLRSPLVVSGASRCGCFFFSVSEVVKNELVS